ncbi:MAG: (d)CMP kinase [Bacteroidia bacterium]|nr:(d)CMP kinase [Bacteroidia bacterium]
MSQITIAIDGYAGTGKSSTAKAVAKALGYTYIDTGAMYRAVTMYLLDHNIPFEDNSPALLAALDQIHLDFRPGKQVGDLEIYLNDAPAEPAIRDPRISKAVSPVAALTAVRNLMVAQQRRIGEHGGVVMDGRDIGTYVFPHADLKVFMTASVDIRTQRRQAELALSGIDPGFEEIQANLQERDKIDSTRAMAPLKQASDAVLIDSSGISFEEQVKTVIQLAESRIQQNNLPPQ